MNETILTRRAVRWIIAALITFTVYSVFALVTTLVVVSYLVSRFTAPPTLEYTPPEQPVLVCEGEPLEILIRGIAHAVASRTEVSHTIYYDHSNRVALVLDEPVPPFSGNPLAEPGPFEIGLIVPRVAELEPGEYVYSRTSVVYTGGNQDSITLAFEFEVVDCE